MKEYTGTMVIGGNQTTSGTFFKKRDVELLQEELKEAYKVINNQSDIIDKQDDEIERIK